MERTPSPRPEGRGDSSQRARQGDQSQSSSGETSADREKRYMPFSKTVPGPNTVNLSSTRDLL